MLGQLGFGPTSKRAMRTVLSEPVLHLSVHGTLSESVHVQRGVGQGCPLAPLLLAISTEPVGAALESGHFLHGIDAAPAPNLKASLFADDVTVYVGDAQDTHGLLRCNQLYERASGAKLGLAKGSILFLQQPFPTPPGLIVRQPNEAERILGVPIGHEDAARACVNRIIDTIRERCVAHASDFPMLGRAVLLNTRLLPKLHHVCRYVRLTAQQSSELREIVRSFLFRRQLQDRVALDKVARPLREGGLGVEEPLLAQGAAMAMWVPAMLRAPSEPWARLLEEDIKRIAEQASTPHPLLSRWAPPADSSTALAPAIVHWLSSMAPFCSLWLQPEYWRHPTVQHLPLWHSPLFHLEPPDSHHPRTGTHRHAHRGLSLRGRLGRSAATRLAWADPLRAVQLPQIAASAGAQHAASDEGGTAQPAARSHSPAPRHACPGGHLHPHRTATLPGRALAYPTTAS